MLHERTKHSSRTSDELIFQHILPTVGEITDSRSGFKLKSIYSMCTGVCPYLQDTVTSILVAGTLVLRGSNSPIDAIISTHEANEHPQRNKEKRVRGEKIYLITTGS